MTTRVAEHLAAVDGDTFLIHARPVDITTTSHGSNPALLQRLWDMHKGSGYTEHRCTIVPHLFTCTAIKTKYIK